MIILLGLRDFQHKVTTIIALRVLEMLRIGGREEMVITAGLACRLILFVDLDDRLGHLAPETMLNAVDTMADAAGLGMTPVEPPVPPVPPVSPVLRLIGQEENRVA